MSKIVKPTGHRELSHVVQVDSGKYYMVDSNDTFDCGYETMVFEWDEKKDEVSNWLEAYVERYSDKDIMASRHEQICNNLEQYVCEERSREMSGDVMPKKQSEFINDLKEQMLVGTNMTENEAYDFAFRVWQHQDYLHWYIEMKWGDDNG